MATANPFDLLGEFDIDDPSQIIAAKPQKPAPSEKKAPAPAAAAAKLPSKPLPPAQAVKEAKNDNARGGSRSGGRGFGRGRGGGGFNQDSASNENTFNNNNGYSDRYKPAEDGESRKPLERRNYGSTQGNFQGGRRGGFNNGDAAEVERPRRTYERHSGTGRGYEIKRDGAGRGNWGTLKDDIAPETEEPTNENESIIEAEKQVVDEVTGDANKDDIPVVETEEKEPENKEMTLEEYEKVLEEKRKALLAQKAEERKVVVDKDFEKMQLLSNKKSDDEIFVKLGSDKDKRKEAAEKEEKAKKQSVIMNDLLKPAQRSGGAGGRRGGRGRGGPGDGFSGRNMVNKVAAAPSIDDVGHFPSLCAK